MDTPGVFIAVEGADGTGKTEVTKIIADILRDKKLDVVQTYEVGGTPIGKELRKLCFTTRSDELIDPTARLLMVAASRLQHLENVIKPAWDAGQVIVCDRFNASTYAYQVCVDGLSVQFDVLRQIFKLSCDPDIYIYLRGDLEKVYERSVARKNLDNDAYKYGLETAKKIHEGYEEYFTRIVDKRSLFKPLIIKIDVNQDLQGVTDQLLALDLPAIVAARRAHNRKVIAFETELQESVGALSAMIVAGDHIYR